MAYLELVETKLRHQQELVDKLEALEIPAVPPPVGEEDRRKEISEADPEVT